MLIILNRVDRGAKLNSPTEGPYEIVKVYNNGTIKIKRNKYFETISITRVKPFNE